MCWASIASLQSLPSYSVKLQLALGKERCAAAFTRSRTEAEALLRRREASFAKCEGKKGPLQRAQAGSDVFTGLLERLILGGSLADIPHCGHMAFVARCREGGENVSRSADPTCANAGRASFHAAYGGVASGRGSDWAAAFYEAACPSLHCDSMACGARLSRASSPHPVRRDFKTSRRRWLPSRREVIGLLELSCHVAEWKWQDSVSTEISLSQSRLIAQRERQRLGAQQSLLWLQQSQTVQQLQVGLRSWCLGCTWHVS